MSKATDKVKWCLTAANKGLKKTKSNQDEAEKHVKKAEHNFKAILFFEKSEFSDWAPSAIFYTIYHCFLAIIAKFGYESLNQSCTIALIEQLKEEEEIIISQDILETLKNTEHEESLNRNTIQLRENFQYGTQTSLSTNILEDKKELCKKALEETKEIIYKYL